MPMAEAIASDYRILVSRANLRPEAELYSFNVRDANVSNKVLQRTKHKGD